MIRSKVISFFDRSEDATVYGSHNGVSFPDMCTMNFENKYIQDELAKVSQANQDKVITESLKIPEIHRLSVWNWTKNRFMILDCRRIRKMTPLGVILKNVR